jgi:hypothetical protein
MHSLRHFIRHQTHHYRFLSVLVTHFRKTERNGTYDIFSTDPFSHSTENSCPPSPITVPVSAFVSTMSSETKKGHGGGKNTNREGKGFEALTDNIPHLIEQGFEREQWNKTSKHGFTLSKIFYGGLDMGGEGAVENIQLGGKRIIYLAQGGFKCYMEKEYGLQFPRNPDEAYLVLYSDGRKVMKILEKKAQSVEGSADTKLMAANAFREEYRFFGEGQFKVEYAFCLSDFFKEKFESTAKKNRKYLFLRQLLKREGIEVFYGEDADYFERLEKWIHREPAGSSATVPHVSSNMSSSTATI